MAVSQSLTVTQESQNKVNNTSVIRIKWTSTQSGASYNSYTNTAYYYVSVNGGTETKYSVSYTLPKSSTTTIVNKTLTVNHNANGACSVKVRTWMDTEISAGTVQQSKTLTLDTIPRKSTLTVANGTLGTAQTLTVSRQATNFTHSIKVVCGSLTRYIKADGSLSTTEVKHSDCSIPFTLPLTWANQNTTGKSASVKFTITTYNGSATIGSNTYTKTFTIPSTAGPGAPDITLSDATGLSTTYNGYVQNKSKLNVSATATTKYDATISSYTLYLNDQKCNGLTNITLPSAGPHTIKVVATDSRGYTSSSEPITIDVLEYSKPTISLMTTKSEADKTLTLSYNLTYVPLNEKNKIKIDVYSNPSLSENTTIISDSTEITGEHVINNIDPDMTYNNVYVRVTDALGEYGDSAKSTVWGNERIFNVHPSGQGIGFGKKVSKSNLFECKWDAEFLGNVVVNDHTVLDESYIIELFNNSAGVYNNITWSNANISEFRFVEIFYTDDTGNSAKSTRVHVNGSSSVNVELSNIYPAATNGLVYLRSSIFKLTDTNLAWVRGRNTTINGSTVTVTDVAGAGSGSGNSRIKITGIYGYK